MTGRWEKRLRIKETEPARGEERMKNRETVQPGKRDEKEIRKKERRYQSGKRGKDEK